MMKMDEANHRSSVSSLIVPRQSLRTRTWIHNEDAVGILGRKVDGGLLNEEVASQIRSLIEHGYAHLREAVDAPTVDRFRDLFDDVWDAPPSGLQFIDGDGVVGNVTRAQRDQIVRVVGLHAYCEDGPQIVFPAAVYQLLDAIYERPPVCFQSMSFRHGSQQPFHLDTAYLPLSPDPMSLMASWTALQDVEPGTGELTYYEGSHRLDQFLFGGSSKSVAAEPGAHAAFLEYLASECERRGLKRRAFTPRKGDVLVWSGDLVHGGGPLRRAGSLRRSLVCHFMPLGHRPTFYDASQERVIRYGRGFRLRRHSESGSYLRSGLRAVAGLVGSASR